MSRWRERRAARRHTVHQPAPVAAAALPTGRTRRGLVKRYAGQLVARRITRALEHPAAAPFTALAIGLVVAAVALGVVLGAALAAAARAGEQ